MPEEAPFPRQAPPGPAPRRRRAELLLSLASVLAVLALVALAEFAVRLTGWTPPDTSMGPFHVYSEVYGWRLRKNLHFEDNGVRTTTNGLGYRGPAVPREKQEGRLRIVLLGDSVTFGLDVDDERVFSHILEARRGDVEVANLAVPGYDPGQEAIKLEREGLALSPDVVVLGLCLSNDFADAVLPVFLYDGRHPKLYFTVENDRLVQHDDQLRLSVREKLAIVLTEQSRLFQYLTLPHDVAAPQVSGWQKRRKKALKDREAALDLTARLVGRMKNATQRVGATFIVLAFHDIDTFEGRSPWLDDLVAAAPMRGVAVVDMAERFRRKGLSFRDVTLDGIGHLSPNGHAATAEVLAEDLVVRGLLPRDPQPRL